MRPKDREVAVPARVRAGGALGAVFFALRFEGPMRTRVSIRVSEPSDEAFIRELGRAAFTEYSSEAEQDTAHMARAGPTLIAVREEQRLGLAVLQIEGASAHLAAIAVVETARGLGVGAALLQAVERLAHERGVRRLTLTTADSNLAALDLFLKRGFRREARGAGRYARGQRTIDLAKRL